MPESTVYLALGSNIGDRQKNLRDAIAGLADAGVRVTKSSSIYETEPVDYLNQPWFLNAVVEGTTDLAALDLLDSLREIEARMGSRKEIPKGPRLIDLDILLYGQDVLDTPELQVPHPRMHLRRFVLMPLAEVAPEAEHPVLHARVAELLARTPDSSKVRPLTAAP